MIIFGIIGLIFALATLAIAMYNLGFEEGGKDWTYTPELHDEIDSGDKTYLVTNIALHKDILENESLTITAWEKK